MQVSVKKRTKKIKWMFKTLIPNKNFKWMFKTAISVIILKDSLTSFSFSLSFGREK